jgi:hypothetical protein
VGYDRIFGGSHGDGPCAIIKLVDERWDTKIGGAEAQQGVFLPHLRMETDPISEASCYLLSRIMDDGKRPETQ